MALAMLTSSSLGYGSWAKKDSESIGAFLCASLVSLERQDSSCIVIHAGMFAVVQGCQT